MNSNPALDFAAAPSYRRYGFETTVAGPWLEGAPVTWTFFLEDSTFSIENYNLSVAAHEDALRQAGCGTVSWHQPRVSPEGETRHGAAFWQPFLKSSPITFLECVK